MPSLSPVTLGQSWQLIYDATVSGDFVGGLNLIGGNYAYVRIATSLPSASASGWPLVGSSAVELSKANGDKLYGKSSGNAVVQLDSAQFPDSFPPGVFAGLRAMTIQGYTEANVKNGVQYEVASYNAALAASGNVRTIFVTGAKPVAVKARLVSFDGAGIEARVYKGATYTGGTAVPYFNLSDINPVVGTVQLIAGATISAVGTEFGARSYLIGSVSPGSQTVGAFGVTGQERNLAPNTTYMLELVSMDAAKAQRVAAYLSWYEGGLDLPRAE
jgi:hypothetical protein